MLEDYYINWMFSMRLIRNNLHCSCYCRHSSSAAVSVVVDDDDWLVDVDCCCVSVGSSDSYGGYL